MTNQKTEETKRCGGHHCPISHGTHQRPAVGGSATHTDGEARTGQRTNLKVASTMNGNTVGHSEQRRYVSAQYTGPIQGTGTIGNRVTSSSNAKRFHRRYRGQWYSSSVTIGSPSLSSEAAPHGSTRQTRRKQNSIKIP